MSLINKIKSNLDSKLDKRKKARKSFKEFIKYIKKDKYTFTNFHKDLANNLQKFVDGKADKSMLFAPPQHGKKIINSERVLTTKGWKCHGDLQVNDKVFGRDGKPKKVLNIMNESIEPDCNYEIEFTDGEKIVAHAQHEWVLIKNRRREVKMETQEIYRDDYFRGVRGKRGSRCIYQVDPNKLVEGFENNELPIHPYLLGLWLGDGQTTAPDITHHHKDTESIDKVVDLGYKITSTYRHKDTGVITTRFWGETYQKFKSLDFAHAEGQEKYIPNRYKFTSKDNRLELLAGLIDSDGYVYQKNGRITFSNANKKLIDDVKDVCTTLGFRVTISEFEPKISTSGIEGKQKIYQLTFNPTIAIPTSIPRKKTNILRGKNYRRGIINIKKVKPEKGKCITVEGGVYLVGKNLIPTHNSEQSSRLLPAFLLGLDPSTKIALVCYSKSVAESFSRDVQKIIESPEYRELFPNTIIDGVGCKKGTLTRNKYEVGTAAGGYLISVGIGGPLTSKTVDVAIIDDLYKSHKEAWSSTFREHVENWYWSVLETRLHNYSKILMLYTRWHENDLAGNLLKEESELWNQTKYEILKTHKTKDNKADKREIGEPLWPEKHNKEKALRWKERDPIAFEALGQQNPKPKEGMMYPNHKTYSELPKFDELKMYHIYKAQVDTADEGNDYLAAITYIECDGLCYVTDIYYTQDQMEITELETAKLLAKNNVDYCMIESNNGGKGFSRQVRRKLLKNTNADTYIEWFHQSDNKTAKIFSNSARVMNRVIFPDNWKHIWPEAYESFTNYTRSGTNDHDDLQDVLSEIVQNIETGDLSAEENDNNVYIV